MLSTDFYLYRLKLVRPHQQSFFHENLSRSDVFLEALKERPSVELRKGHFWHIGNLAVLDNFGGYFAIGRTTNSILEKYDDSSGNFVEELLETSPYTHVIFDARIGFLAIAKKTKLSPTVGGIARNICRLFERAEVVIRNDIEVSIDPISDPYNFIDAIRAAYSIRAFEVTFSRSNPFDADEFFQKPMEKYLDAANGEKGKTNISGVNLDSETLVDVTKSIAATGNDAKVVLKVREGVRYSTKRLRDNPAHFAIEEGDFTPEIALTEARETYTYVRGEINVVD